MKQNDFDVVVIGGGHAGCEAADAAARMGASTVLVTMRLDTIGAMSCNPAIGGLGKGHLVREIDAMDGVMGRVADYAGIQFRLLNRRKGPAVQGPRAQADRARYRTKMLDLMQGRENLALLEGEVADFLMDGDKVAGVVLGDGSEIRASSVILTTGTFLRGVIHLGDVSRPGGRVGDRPSVSLAERLDSFDLPLGRLKTGTPPRLDGRTIDWDRLDMQPGDDDPVVFSFLSQAPVARQISCGVTHTNETTHDIIRANLDRSAMYGGHIQGVGPRYCPSIEDKVVRFADKSSHQIFLEPEGLDTHTVYPNGISTSLPVDVQEAYVRSIAGLEKVEIEQPGYAIEYDYVDPRALTPGLQVRDVEGLFLAGQINGTTGYEEAAAQGLVAGLNAARRARAEDEIRFSRSSSYIGVMIDDLITRGVTEPYRMFTSRAEFRLSLRADNADQRLTAFGRELGCVADVRWDKFSQKREDLEVGRALLKSRKFTARSIAELGININPDKPSRDGVEVLSLSDADFDTLAHLDPVFEGVAPDIREQLKRDSTYASYVRRQESDAAALKREEDLQIPADLDLGNLPGLSNELKLKLERVRPSSIGHARRIDGMTASGLMILLSAVQRHRLKRTA